MYFFEQEDKKRKQPFLINDRGESITYEQLDVFCEKMGAHMEGRTLVFLLCKNTIGSVLGYFSCLRKRTVPLLLDAEMDYDMIHNMIEIYHPDYIYAPQERLEWKQEGKMVFAEYGYYLQKRDQKQKTILHEDLALLLTTSGSTGSPKLVRQSYQNIQANAQSIAEYLELGEAERPITTLPMNYTYGLSVIHSHVLCKATILLTEHSVFEQEFWDFFQKEGATSIAGVPFTYEMLKKLGFFQMELPTLRTMTQAGGKLPAYLQQEFASYAKEKGKKFIVMYGQTEATARMAYLPEAYARSKAGSIGIPIPGGRFSIEDGELVYQGKNVTLGYAQNEKDLAKGDERNGILYTGDMARMDEEGFYYIIGRKKRFLKILGNRVNLDEIEQMLKERYRDAAFACTGVDDALDIYIEKGQEVDVEVLISDLSRKTRLNRSVFGIFFIDRIPVNDSGKIQYKKLEELRCHMS